MFSFFFFISSLFLVLVGRSIRFFHLSGSYGQQNVFFAAAACVCWRAVQRIPIVPIVLITNTLTTIATCRLCSVCCLVLCLRYCHRCRRSQRRRRRRRRPCLRCCRRRQVDDTNNRIVFCLSCSYWPVIVNWSTLFVTNTIGGNNSSTNAYRAQCVMPANRSCWDRANCIRTPCVEHLTTSSSIWIYCERLQRPVLSKRNE